MRKRKPAKRRPDSAVLAFGRRCLRAKDPGAENAAMKRNLKAYMKKHRLTWAKGGAFTKVMFGRGALGPQAARNCYWSFSGYFWDDEISCELWQYECDDGAILGSQLRCKPRGPKDPPPEVVGPDGGSSNP